MAMERLLRSLGGGIGQNAQPTDAPVVDTAEQVYISSLALLKMLKHGRAGVPMEVMGLMLGEFVDEYTVRVIDVFAMPQSGTGVSVEAVDPVFQARMLDMLRQTGLPEMVVGWYHSHPGFGCWLSGVDINTQQSFEALSERAVAVVIDPIQALIHGLNRHYYSMPIVYRKNEHEQQMLMNLHKSKWQDSLTIGDFEKCKQKNIDSIKNMVKLAKNYKNYIDDESKMTKEELNIRNYGKIDPKRHLEEQSEVLNGENIVQCLSAMLSTIVFQ